MQTRVVELIAGRWAPEPAGADRPGRARDTLTGGLVTVLRASAPADPAHRDRALDRLRRYARTRHPGLAEVRAVELTGDEIAVVCEPLTGVLLDPGPPPAGLTVGGLQELAAVLLDALAALHRAGVVHGAVAGDAVLLPTGRAPAAPAVTLLPLPLRPAEVPAPLPAPGGTAADDTVAAATVLLGLLGHVRPAGTEEEVLALGLSRAFERTGAEDGTWGPPGSGLSWPAAHRSAAPVPLAVGGASLAPGAAGRHSDSRGEPPAGARAGAARRPRWPSRRGMRRGVLGGLLVAAVAATTSPAPRGASPGSPPAQGSAGSTSS